MVHKMLRAMIVEDEYLAKEELMYLINAYSQIEIVATFDDGLEAFEYLQHNQVDIVFLDIQIPSINGMLLARNIYQFAKKPHIVFTTAHKKYAIDAFDLEAFDYLLKPFSEERMIRLLKKLEASHPPEEIEQTRKTINVHSGSSIKIIDISSINYAIANDKTTQLYTATGDFWVPLTMSELVERLPEKDFFRTHRSYCVALDKITEIIPWLNSTYIVKLIDSDERIPVSRTNIKTFRKLMKL